MAFLMKFEGAYDEICHNSCKEEECGRYSPKNHFIRQIMFCSKFCIRFDEYNIKTDQIPFHLDISLFLKCELHYSKKSIANQNCKPGFIYGIVLYAFGGVYSSETAVMVEAFFNYSSWHQSSFYTNHVAW